MLNQSFVSKVISIAQFLASCSVDILKFNQTKFLASHILLWIGVWFFFVYFFSYNSSNSLYVTWFSSILLPLTMATTYTTVYYLIPKYLITRNYGLFVLYSTYTLIFTSYIVILTMFGSFMPLSNFNVVDMPPMSRNFVFILILVYLIVGLVSFVSILNYNFKTLSKNKALENKILDAQLKIKDQELHYLKKQIHPHFLFNSLNTIYGFSLKKSEQTPDVILKLSNLLDYILYQVQQPKVALKQEIIHIEDYISLEQIRFQDTLKTKVNYNTFNPNLEIPPMLFLPFVENAFKHGAILNGFLQIEMTVNVQTTSIEFELKNTVKSKTPANGNGLGLPTIRKRLDLLYPDNYELNSSLVNNWYTVNLKLNTNV